MSEREVRKISDFKRVFVCFKFPDVKNIFSTKTNSLETNPIIRRALLIDDDPLSAFLSASVLKGAKYFQRVYIQNCPIQALEFLSKSLERKFPNIIFLDMMMPKMNGFDFIRHYEDLFYAKFPTTKIIILSNSNRSTELQKSLLKSSVSGFIDKPLEKVSLAREIGIPVIHLN